MDSNIQNQPQPLKPIGATMASAATASAQTATDRVSEAAHAVREQFQERGTEVVNEAKQKISDAYDQTSKSVNEQYEKAVDYGRENPGKTTLIAFGVGVGVGVLLLNSFSDTRSRRSRMVEPVMNAVSTFARELFR